MHAQRLRGHDHAPATARGPAAGQSVAAPPPRGRPYWNVFSRNTMLRGGGNGEIHK